MSGMTSSVAKKQTAVLPGGRTVLISPLTMVDIGTIEQEALQVYCREYLEKIKRNAEFFPENERSQKQQEAWQHVMNLDSASLPKKTGDTPVVRDGKLVFDNGKPIMQKRELDYAQWWMMNTFAGQAFATWLSIRKEQPDITYDDFGKLFGGDPNVLQDIANQVGKLSEPSVGNDSASSDN